MKVTPDNGNGTPIIVGIIAVIVAAAGGTWYYLRRRWSNGDPTAD